jgi:hypothetical protein
MFKDVVLGGLLILIVLLLPVWIYTMWDNYRITKNMERYELWRRKWWRENGSTGEKRR